MNMANSKIKAEKKSPDDERMHYGYVFGFVTFVIVLSCFYLGYQHLMQPTSFPIRNVRVEGEFLNLEPEDLRVMVSQAVRGGFFNVNVGEIKEILLQEPWIHSVIVMRTWPDTINVKVSENVAVARWKDGGFLNNEGGYFSPERKININLPVLHGPSQTFMLLLDRYRYLETELGQLGLRVQELKLSNRKAWEIKMDGDLRVLVGRNAFDEKIDIFTEHVYPNLNDRFDDIDLIDLRYTNGFSIKWQDLNNRS